MVQNPLSPNDRVHWTVQIFQDDDWRRKEKMNLRHDRKIKSSVWTRHPIYGYHHPRVQIPVVCGKKNHVVVYHPWMRLNENHPPQFTFLLDDEPACALVCCCESCVIFLRICVEFFAVCTELREQSRTRKTETERETEESAVCDRKRRRNGFRNGNIGCSIFRHPKK